MNLISLFKNISQFANNLISNIVIIITVTLYIIVTIKRLKLNIDQRQQNF